MTMCFLYNDEISLHQLSVLRHGECTACGEQLKWGCKVFAGKMHDGCYAVVCEKCKDKIESVLRDYVYYNEEFVMPSMDARLWRYQDFAKFVSLLDSGKLFFTRADSFEDPFECARGFNFQEDAIYADVDKYLHYQVMSQLKDSRNNNPSDDEIKNALAKEKHNYLKKQEEKRKDYYVSCWHENERESEGMWKLYTTALSQGVAVQTTTERLCKALGSDSFKIGKVNYITYDNPLQDSHTPVWYKRDSFVHEREVRVVIKDIDGHEKGKLVPIDLDTLIENIYVSPTSAPWLSALIKSVMHRYGIDKPVQYSQLNKKPLF